MFFFFFFTTRIIKICLRLVSSIGPSKLFAILKLFWRLTRILFIHSMFYIYINRITYHRFLKEIDKNCRSLIKLFLQSKNKREDVEVCQIDFSWFNETYGARFLFNFNYERLIRMNEKVDEFDEFDPRVSLNLSFIRSKIPLFLTIVFSRRLSRINFRKLRKPGIIANPSSFLSYFSSSTAPKLNSNESRPIRWLREDNPPIVGYNQNRVSLSWSCREQQDHGRLNGFEKQRIGWGRFEAGLKVENPSLPLTKISNNWPENERLWRIKRGATTAKQAFSPRVRTYVRLAFLRYHKTGPPACNL